jgi:hypothetical protein
VTISIVGTDPWVSLINPNILDFHPPLAAPLDTYYVDIKLFDGINSPTFLVSYAVVGN